MAFEAKPLIRAKYTRQLVALSCQGRYSFIYLGLDLLLRLGCRISNAVKAEGPYGDGRRSI
jgi:hypothetical protein